MRILGATITIVIETDYQPLETRVELDGPQVENDIRGVGVAIASALVLPITQVQAMIEEKRAEEQ